MHMHKQACTVTLRHSGTPSHTRAAPSLPYRPRASSLMSRHKRGRRSVEKAMEAVSYKPSSTPPLLISALGGEGCGELKDLIAAKLADSVGRRRRIIEVRGIHAHWRAQALVSQLLLSDGARKHWFHSSPLMETSPRFSFASSTPTLVPRWCRRMSQTKGRRPCRSS